MLVDTKLPQTVGPTQEQDCEPAVVGHSKTVQTSDIFYRELVQSMRNGVLAIRRDGTVAVINEVAYRTLGLARDARCVGRHYEECLGPRHPFSEAFALAFDMATLPNRSEVRLGTPGKVLGYTLSRITDANQRRKLPRQVDTAKGDCTGGFSLGRNVRGGTRPRLSCGRSWL